MPSAVSNSSNYTFSFGETDLWRRFYRENGFVSVSNVYSEEECEKVLKIYEKYAKPDFRGIMNLDRGVVEYRETVNGQEHVECLQVADDDALTVRRMVSAPEVVAILETLQEAEVVLLQTMFLFKRPGTPYSTQAWNPHQDNAYPMAPYGMYLTGNVALEDQDLENGCMNIYPGSHLEPLLPNVKVKSFHEEPGQNPGHCVDVPVCYRNRKTDLYLKRGSILMLHGNVIHGSYPNLSKTRMRPMLLIPYGTRGISKMPSFVPGQVAQRMEIPLR